MIQTLKKYAWIPILFLCYLLYKQFSKTPPKTYNGGNVVPGTGGTVVNLDEKVEALWHECVDSWFGEDETLCISIINSIPIAAMRQFANLWNVKAANFNRTFWSNPITSNQYNPREFVADMGYYLESRIEEIRPRLNAL